MTQNCTYCGSHWEPSRDHVIPNSLLRHTRRTFKGDWVVPACRECNTFLGYVPIATVPERAAYLIPKYLNRYRKILNLPVWSESELEEVSDSFRQDILAAQFQKSEIEQRLEMLNVVAAKPLDFMRKE